MNREEFEDWAKLRRKFRHNQRQAEVDRWLAGMSYTERKMRLEQLRKQHNDEVSRKQQR